MARARDMAGPAIAANFVHPDWVMSADEFVAFWGGTRLVSVGTVGKSGWPHAAPVEVALEGDRFSVPAFANSVRREDLEVNPRMVLTAWDDAWHAAIVYGRIEGRIDLGTGPLVMRPTRIYAMRARRGHHAWRAALGA